MSKLLTPNEILSVYQSMSTLLNVSDDHDLVVDVKEVRDLVSKSLDGINEVIQSLIPNAVLSVQAWDDGEVSGFIVRFIEGDKISRSHIGRDMSITTRNHASFSFQEKCITAYLELLNNVIDSKNEKL